MIQGPTADRVAGTDGPRHLGHGPWVARVVTEGATPVLRVRQARDAAGPVPKVQPPIILLPGALSSLLLVELICISSSFVSVGSRFAYTWAL